MDSYYEISKKEATKQYIEDNKLFNVFVFGLPRTGTSMMTNICIKLGVNMLHTSDEKENDYAHLGEHYHPNETGFFEITRDSMEHFFKIAGTPYSGCKMIIPVKDARWELIKMLPSKVIMMWREPEEIRQSQEAFYSKKSDIAYLRSALVEQKLDLEQNNIDYLKVNYRDVIKNPLNEIMKVKDFILSDKNVKNAVNYVDEKRYRFDKDKITVGL